MPIKNTFEELANYSLYKNAVWLIVNSVVISGFGFLFWTVVARLYSTTQVGLASTLISSLELISMLSLMGFNISLVRYISKSDEKSDMISSCLMLSGVIALIISLVYILLIDFFSPSLAFLKDVRIYSVLFVIFVVSYVFFTHIESVFIGLRKSKLVLIKNTIFSVFKIVFSFLLVFLGAYGIFSSMALSALIAFILILFFLKIKIRLIIKKQIIIKMLSFSLSNYIANSFRYAPAFILPIIITNTINPETTAYFYIAMMISNILFIVPVSISNSLLAEGSHDINNLKENVKKSLKFSYMVLIPGFIFVLIFGSYLLMFFGQSYSENASLLLKMLSFSPILFTVNAVYISVMNIRHMIKKVVFVNFLIFLGTLFISYEMISFGLVGIGIGWLSGQFIGNIFVLLDIIKSKGVL
ncbi:MAG: oligosaccharide flippase family protein [Candidatus Nanoarchaeia archaeon]|nr:oligosaccharide flippase family protein [Candidatus Nanoarchaeia archaeon]